MSTGAPPLVMRCGAFGDMVLLTVLLRHLHTRFGRPVDVIASGAWTGALLAGQPGVGRLFVIRSRRSPYWLSLDQQRLVGWLRGRGLGPTWFCDLGPGKALLQRGGIPTDHICDSRAYPWVPGESFADRYIRLGNEAPSALAATAPPPVTTTARRAQIEVTDAQRRELDDWLASRGLLGRPCIVVHPGSRHVARRRLRQRTGASKYWPEENWAQVVRALRDLQPEHAILLSGTSAEKRFTQDIIHRSGVSDAHDLAAALPIARLLPLLERAHSMICVDTGPGHAAAALGCPTVALFGTADAALFRPGGAVTPAVALTGVTDGRQNILGISVETVINAWIALAHTPQKTARDSVKSLT
ncbi:MAG TPA: glycosyltransferase family 9 protein [Steroidobacteraceae bacterium]